MFKNKKIFSIVYILMAVIFIGLLYKIDILPSNMFFGILFGMVFISVTVVLLFIKMSNKIVNVIMVVIMTILMLLFGYGTYQICNTVSFLSSINDINIEDDKFYVVVKKDSQYKNVRDLKNKNMGYMHDMDVSVWDKLKVEVDSHKYDDQVKLCDDLINNAVDSIIVNGAYLYFMEEYNEDFVNDVRVIYTIKIKKSVKKEEVVSKNDSVFTIYISGIDTYGNISKVSRSDVNILMTVNSNTGKVLLTTIPRDYYVQLHNTTGYKDKLTHAGIYGVNMSVETIEDLLGVDINYYVRINFSTLVKLIDEIGGVDINSDASFNKRGCNINYGFNHLDGKCALSYSRERKIYSSGDRHRGQNQQQVIEAIINKITGNRELLLKYNDLIKSMKGTFESNFDATNISKLVKSQFENNTKWNVESISVDGYDSSNYTYSYYGSRLYVMEPDYETVKVAHDKILEVINQ